jgi:cytochrome c554/c'-like protein
VIEPVEPVNIRDRARVRVYVALAIAALALVSVVFEAAVSGQQRSAAQELAAINLENRFPSATTCAACHEEIYREWSVSAHAYGQLSPVFNAMSGKISKLTNGTNGDFCVRCHTQVGMNLGEPEFMSNLDRNPTSREGVTCVICHRQDRAYSKISGRLPLVQGGLYTPIFGPLGPAELNRVLASGEYNLQSEPNKPGRGVHGTVVKFDALPTPGFCGSCHDVNLVNGFRLEEAFSEYKNAPAAKDKKNTCQDCHMGVEPGKPSGYRTGPAARIGGKDTRPRKRTNHMFAGPDYSIVHAGMFPHNPRAQALATLREWLTFDYKAGWGTDAFERSKPADMKFPPRWAEPDDRYDAAAIIKQNQALLDDIGKQRLQVLRAGYVLGDVKVDRADEGGIKFKVQFKNGTDGHNVPTGFDAERIVWLHVTVTDSRGKVAFESGDTDPNGDIRDSHSLYVHDGKLPLDKYLFSLQSRFIVRMVRGGEREQVLAVNYSPDASPFLRPSTTSTILTGRPVGARKHKQTIDPLGSKWPSYEVSRRALAGTVGPYKVNLQVKAAMVPPNLVAEIESVGFDYGMTPRQVSDAVIEGAVLVWDKTVELTRTREASAASPGSAPAKGASR